LKKENPPNSIKDDEQGEGIFEEKCLSSLKKREY
jgi:hypothetical protein